VNTQSIIQVAASLGNVVSVIVLAVGYYFLIKLYREWIHLRKKTREAGGRPMVVVAADYSYLPEVTIAVRNFNKAPAKELSFEFSAPVENPDGTVLSDAPYFKEGLPFLEPEGEINHFWGHLPDLAPRLREKGLEDGIKVTTRYKDLAGEPYETEWTINPLLFEGGRIENSKGMNDLVNSVEKLSKEGVGQNGPWRAASSNGE